MFEANLLSGVCPSPNCGQGSGIIYSPTIFQFNFRSTIRSTKLEVLHDFGGLRRSPRVCKSLKNLRVQDCHGRGRGFEPRRPRHISLRNYRLYGTSDRKTY